MINKAALFEEKILFPMTHLAHMPRCLKNLAYKGYEKLLESDRRTYRKHLMLHRGEPH